MTTAVISATTRNDFELVSACAQTVVQCGEVVDEKENGDPAQWRLDKHEVFDEGDGSFRFTAPGLSVQFNILNNATFLTGTRADLLKLFSPSPT